MLCLADFLDCKPIETGDRDYLCNGYTGITFYLAPWHVLLAAVRDVFQAVFSSGVLAGKNLLPKTPVC